MRVYFLSCAPAALKLDGEYVGIIDGFERFCELDESKRVLVEIVPESDLQPVNFFIDGHFWERPPQFVDVYKMSGERLVNVRAYYPKDGRLKVILQRKFLSFTVTVYYQCGVFLSVEGADFFTRPLPDDYAQARAEQVEIDGQPCLALYGGSHVCVIGTDGKIIFENEVEYCRFGSGMEVRAPLYTSADSRLECVFGYKDGALDLTDSHLYETCGETELVFLFFERVLTDGDFAALLDEDLKSKASSLKKYLGDFEGVFVPTERFYAANNGENAAGLVYRKGENIYEVIYYAIDTQDGKISNIRPA